MIAFVPALLAKVTLIFAVGLALNAVMHRASASLRHLVLLATLVCGITLPLATIIAPRWNVALLPAPSAPAIVPAAENSPLTVDSRTPQSINTVSPTTSDVVQSQSRAASNVGALPIEPASAIILVWTIGFLVVGAWLLMGRVRLRRIARDAWPLASADWQRILDNARTEAGVSREVKLGSSSVVSTPLTWGTRAPIILLPEEALDWLEEHRRVVLRHEMAHIARGDSLVQQLAGFVCAIYWFHPFAWMIERRLRAECERACDDQVVSLGTPATDYAAHLLEVARSARSFGAPGFLSVAMARPSQLEGRLLAVLNESRERVAASRSARWTAAAISALVLLPLAAFRPVERSASVERLSKLQADDAPQAIVTPIKEKAIAQQPAVENGIAYDAGKKFDSTFQLSAPVRSGGTLHIDLKTGGGITITPWDRPEVSVKARLAGRNWRETRVTLEPSNGNATLASDFTRDSRNQSTSHDFDIKLPREFNVEIRSSGGSVSITGMSGSFSGQTGGGDIDLRALNGRVDISTGGGEILVENSNVNGSVSTGGGEVRIMGVNGNLRGSSGSGPVIRTSSNGYLKGYGTGSGEGKGEASASASASGSGRAYATSDGGPLNIWQAGGSVYLPSAPSGAHVTTGGGKITIGPAGGAVFAQTGGGDIEIGPAAGSVDAITGAGNVTIAFNGAGSVDVSSGNGGVVITAPSNLDANLELTTAYTNNFRGKTHIISDWPVNVTETSEWDDSGGTPRRYVRVRQQVGRGGPLIRVNTVNGDIALKKGP